MDSTVLAPALLTLAGGLVGTAASFTTGFYTTRVTRDQAWRQQHAAWRLELKEAVLEYIQAVQDCQDSVGEAESSTDRLVLRREAERRESVVWFHQKKLHLMADEDLRAASRALAEKIDAYMYDHAQPEGVNIWDFTESTQDRFLDQARASLAGTQSAFSSRLRRGNRP